MPSDPVAEALARKEDTRAFNKMWNAWQRQDPTGGPESPEAKAMMFAWGWAIRRGQELRGCCEERKDA